MIVRIRFGKGARLGKGRRRNKRLASVAAALLNPAAVTAAALAVWKLTADLNLTRSFAISSGFFSHWQVWLGAAIVLQICSRLLNRYSKTGDAAAR
ncbi:MAG TPA: hypothetical protein VKF41_02490 [Bryobacteraceae bacterium]|nr:hypothetical protein [Bryobacteraceae bacterium]